MRPSFRTYDLAKEVYRNCRELKLPSHLKDQLQRAALSSALNLMEGSAKPTRADKRRFYAIAYGSIREVQAILDITSNQDLLAKADRLGAMAWKLMQAT